MFVNGIAYAVILLPVLLGLLVGLLTLAAVILNRRHSPFGWLVPVVAIAVVFGWYEQDRNGVANPTSAGVVEFGMSSKIEDVLAASTFKFPKTSSGFDGSIFTGEVVDVHFQTGNGLIKFPKVGGLSNSLLIINFRANRSGVSYANFSAQHTPLKLEGALARAKQIEAQLLDAGFSEKQGAQCKRFQLIKATLPGKVLCLRSWSEAEEVLRDNRLGITEMNLFCLTDKTTTIILKLENWARNHSSIYSNNFGREWGMIVDIQNGKCP
jgi:hypothetical protein